MRFRRAIGRTRETAVALCRRLPSRTGLCDIFLLAFQALMGGMTSS